MKKFWVAALILFLSLSGSAAAKIVADKLPLLTYAESPVEVYDSPAGNKKGTIPAGTSLVHVKIIRADGWAYGSYKIANKKRRVDRWFKMDELQGYADFENYVDRATYDVEAYRTRSASNYVGKVSSGEDLIVVAERGERAKIIFKADGKFYRMGWILKSALGKNSAGIYEDFPPNLDDYVDENYDGDFSGAEDFDDDWDF